MITKRRTTILLYACHHSLTKAISCYICYRLNEGNSITLFTLGFNAINRKFKNLSSFLTAFGLNPLSELKMTLRTFVFVLSRHELVQRNNSEVLNYDIMHIPLLTTKH